MSGSGIDKLCNDKERLLAWDFVRTTSAAELAELLVRSYAARRAEDDGRRLILSQRDRAVDMLSDEQRTVYYAECEAERVEFETKRGGER